MRYPIDYDRVTKYLEIFGEEIVRFSKMTIDDIRKHSTRDDFMCVLPRTESIDREITIGIEGLNCVYKISDLFLENHLRKEDFYEDQVHSELKRHIVEHLICCDHEPNDDDLSDMFHSLSKTLENACFALTHHIPCVVTEDYNPNRFHIGPVKFVRSEIFLREKDELLVERARVSIERVNKARKETNKLKGNDKLKDIDSCPTVDAVREFFSAYPWIALVKTKSSHEEVSRNHAIAAVQGALDFLCIFIRRRFARHMRIAYYGGEPRKTAFCHEDETNKIHCSFSTSVKSVLLPDDWFEHLSKQNKWFHTLGGHAIEAIANGLHPAPLWQRYLDALRWFGEAIRDDYIPGRIAKYTTCLERLVISGSGRVRKKFSNRVALLLLGPQSHHLYELKRTEVDEFYGVRCDIVHGDELPNEDILIKADSHGEMYCKDALVRAGDLFSAITRQSSATDAGLAEAFERLHANKPLFDNNLSDPQSTPNPPPPE